MFVRSETFLTLVKRVWLTLLSEVIVSFISKVSRNWFKTNHKSIPPQSGDSNLTPLKTAPVFVLANGNSGMISKGSSSAPGPNGPTQVPGIAVEEFIRQLSLAARKTSNSAKDLKHTEPNRENSKSVSKNDGAGVNEEKVHNSPRSKTTELRVENEYPEVSFSLKPIADDEEGNEKSSKSGRVLRGKNDNVDSFISDLAKASKPLTKPLKNSNEHNDYQPPDETDHEKGKNRKQSKEVDSFSTDNKDGAGESYRMSSSIVHTGKSGNRKGKGMGQNKDLPPPVLNNENSSKPSSTTADVGENEKEKDRNSKPNKSQTANVHNNEGGKYDTPGPSSATAPIGENHNEKGESSKPTPDQTTNEDEPSEPPSSVTTHADKDNQGVGESSLPNKAQTGLGRKNKDRNDEPPESSSVPTPTDKNNQGVGESSLPNKAQTGLGRKNKDRNDEPPESSSVQTPTDKNNKGVGKSSILSKDQGALEHNREDGNDGRTLPDIGTVPTDKDSKALGRRSVPMEDHQAIVDNNERVEDKSFKLSGLLQPGADEGAKGQLVKNIDPLRSSDSREDLIKLQKSIKGQVSKKSARYQKPNRK